MPAQPPPLCPSARPEMEGSVLFGVVGGAPEDTGLVGYLKDPQPATAEVLARAGPLAPTNVFRFAATCGESACVHFDGTDCGLAAKIVDLLPAVVAVLPPCPIRRHCRWWQQEGRAACLRCPLIATDMARPPDALRRAADPGVATDGARAPAVAGGQPGS